jgi:hypothetical protein
MAGAVKVKVNDLDKQIEAKRASTVDKENNVKPVIKLSGVAARGRAIASTKLSFRGMNGVLASVITDSEGKYTIDISSLTLPILLQIKNGTTVYYSVATASGTCNVHPFTDLIVRNWYKVQGANIDDIFASTGTLANPPTVTAIKAMELTLCSVLSELLLSVDIDSNNFDLICSPFSADNTTFDNVLSRTQILNLASGGIIINVIDPNTGNISQTILTTTGNLSITTSGDPLTSATTEINAMLANFMAKPSASYLTANFMNDGYNSSECLAELSSFTSGTLDRIIAYDETQIKCVAVIKFVHAAGISQVILIFSKASGSWQISGDNKIAETDVQFWANEGVTGINTMLKFKVNDKAASEILSISSVTVQGPGIITNLTVPCVADNFSTGTYPVCGTAYGDYTTKAFEYDVELATGIAPVPMPALGSVYTLTVHNTDGSSYSYSSVIEAEYGFDPNGNVRQSDYPQYTLDNPLTLTTLSTLLDGTAHTITGSVYLPMWVNDLEAPHFQFHGMQFDNQVLYGTFTSVPVVGSSANRFTITIPAMTNNGNGTYTGTFNGTQVTDTVTGAWLAADADTDSLLNGDTNFGLDLETSLSSPRKLTGIR